MLIALKFHPARIVFRMRQSHLFGHWSNLNTLALSLIVNNCEFVTPSKTFVTIPVIKFR